MACSFKNQFVFKFGGIDSNFSQNFHIEKLDIFHNIWEVIQLNLDYVKGTLCGRELDLFNTGSAVQINNS